MKRSARNSENHQRIDLHVKLAYGKLEKLSLCKCGNRMARETAAVGETYLVNLDTVREAVLTCGGCGKEQTIRLVNVKTPGGDRGFPIDLLNIGAFVETPKGRIVRVN